jgi:polar amino acid transport system substrate-binding protein
MVPTPLRLLVLLLCLWPVACAGPTGRGTDGAPLVVGSDLDNPPFAYLDAEGRPAGRDVEMTVELARHLGRELVWERLPFEQLLDAVAAGQVDAVVATLGRTPERATRVAFTQPYYATSIVALVRRGDGEPELLEALAGRRVTAGVGTTSERAARLASVPLLLAGPSPKGTSAVERLLAGEVDAAVMDAPDAYEFEAAHPGRLRVLAEPLEVEDYCIAVRPDDLGLRASLDRALDELSVAGVLEELDQRHGL